MKRFPYPKKLLNNSLKKIAVDMVLLMLIVYLVITHEHDNTIGIAILLLYTVGMSTELFNCAKLKYGSIARIDGDYLRINAERIAIADIAAIERQILSGKRHGITMQMRDGKRRAFQFAQLQDEQIDDLVSFLSDAINTVGRSGATGSTAC